MSEEQRDAERFRWLAERLQDVMIDGADACEFLDEREDWIAAWREAIDTQVRLVRDGARPATPTGNIHD